MSRPLDWRSNSKLTFSRLRKIWRKIICCPDGARIPRVSARSTENRFTFRFLRRRLQWWFLPLLSALADETFLFPCVPFDRMVQRERESRRGQLCIHPVVIKRKVKWTCCCCSDGLVTQRCGCVTTLERESTFRLKLKKKNRKIERFFFSVLAPAMYLDYYANCLPEFPCFTFFLGGGGGWFKRKCFKEPRCHFQWRFRRVPFNQLKDSGIRLNELLDTKKTIEFGRFHFST